MAILIWENACQAVDLKVLYCQTGQYVAHCFFLIILSLRCSELQEKQINSADYEIDHSFDFDPYGCQRNILIRLRMFELLQLQRCPKTSY